MGGLGPVGCLVLVAHRSKGKYGEGVHVESVRVAKTDPWSKLYLRSCAPLFPAVL